MVYIYDAALATQPAINLEHISHTFASVSTVNFEQVNADKVMTVNHHVSPKTQYQSTTGDTERHVFLHQILQKNINDINATIITKTIRNPEISGSENDYY